MPVDAVLLALHGAMVAVDHPDVEGEVLAALREVLGPETPLVATLDLHTNVTRKMVANCNALVLYHTAPHVDVFETGQRAAAVLRKILIDGAKPVMAYQKIPAVVPAERANTEDPQSVSHSLKASWWQLNRGRGFWPRAWPRCNRGWIFPNWAPPWPWLPIAIVIWLRGVRRGGR